MTPVVLYWLAAAGLTVTCLAAIQRRSLAEFSRHELEEICRRRNTADRLGQVLQQYEHVGLTAEIVQMICAAVLIGSLVGWSGLDPRLAGLPAWLGVFAAAAVGAALLVVAGIWLPWAVSRVWATPLVYHTWPVWRLVHLAVTPLLAPARLVDKLFHRLAGRPVDVPDEEAFEEEIRTIVSEGHREGLLEEDAREMIEGVIELGDVAVSQIMTPRTYMTGPHPFAGRATSLEQPADHGLGGHAPADRTGADRGSSGGRTRQTGLKDRVHFLDLLEVGLIDQGWCDRFPPKLGARLRGLNDKRDREA